jgi:hypothetical protein
MKRLLDKDYLTGVSTYHHYDPATDLTTIETMQDVQPFIERNKALHNTSYQRDGIKDEWMHVATIPVLVQMKWKQEYNIDIYDPADYKRIQKLLNDPDYRYLKTGTCKA